jgi:hypothetical protein
VNELFTISKNLGSARVIGHAVRRSLFQQKNSGFELTVPDALDQEAAPVGTVEVRIERTVRLQRDSVAFGQDGDSGIESDGMTVEKR